MQGGIAEVRRYHASPIDLIERGQTKPSFIVSSEIGIEDASDRYRRFFQHKETKVVLQFPMAGKGCPKSFEYQNSYLPILPASASKCFLTRDQNSERSAWSRWRSSANVAV
jgi:hypothetical protein